MHSNSAILNMVEERMIGWSWDCRIQILTYALSRVDELPREMVDQKIVLGKLAFKAECYARLREALAGTTANHCTLRIEGPDQPWTLNGAHPHSSETDSRPHMVNRLVDEIKRLEEEISRLQIDYDGICRFLRKMLLD